MTTTQAYLSVQDLIYSLCWRFLKQYGGEWEEVLSIAHESFMDAYNSFDASRSRLTTWTQIKVWGGLMDAHRQEQSSRRWIPRQQDADLDSLQSRSHFDLPKLLNEISEDANTMIRLALNSPHPRAGGIRTWLIRSLLDAGWAAERITESFQEIREIL